MKKLMLIFLLFLSACDSKKEQKQTTPVATKPSFVQTSMYTVDAVRGAGEFLVVEGNGTTLYLHCVGGTWYDTKKNDEGDEVGWQYSISSQFCADLKVSETIWLEKWNQPAERYEQKTPFIYIRKHTDSRGEDDYMEVNQ